MRSWSQRRAIDRMVNALLEAIIGGFSDLYPDAPEGEHIKAAAVRDRKGDIYTGDFHDMAYARMPQTYDNQRANQLNDEGFLTNTNRFVTREQALEIARAQKQLTAKAKKLGQDIVRNKQTNSGQHDLMNRGELDSVHVTGLRPDHMRARLA